MPPTPSPLGPIASSWPTPTAREGVAGMPPTPSPPGGRWPRCRDGNGGTGPQAMWAGRSGGRPHPLVLAGRTVPVNRKARRLDGAGEARLTMLAGSAPPAGRAHRASPPWGPCRGWPTPGGAGVGWPARSQTPSPAPPSTGRSRQQSQALAEPGLVPSPPTECRRRLGHGGWARDRRSGLRQR